ncbi:MAG TPA: hypothetical protein VG324_01620, partial [Blastocatellia bacterium]|nr:hypothetical protein [Blastocatellia bacterium]
MILQIFEQRLEQQRREILALREALAARNDSAKKSVPSNGSSDLEAQPARGASDVSAPDGGQSPTEQILSFRKLAENAGRPVKQKLQSNHSSRSDGSTLYQRIIDWKKEARDGLNNFSADEQEMVDYILSFI